MIKTKFQEIYKTKVPIVQAGMGPYNTNTLCVAAAKSGALGLISTVGMGSFEMPGLGKYKYTAIFEDKTPHDLLEDSIDYVVGELKNFEQTAFAEGISYIPRFGINIPVSEEFIPVAAELIQTTIDKVKSDKFVREHLVAIFTSAGDPLPWSINPGAKKLKESISIKKELPDIIWTHVVPSVRAARRCVKAGVDVIVASGRDGGAHCSWRDTSSMVLIPEIINKIEKPIIAAGGFACGRTLAAALTMGAIGVQMGTRFIATQESDFAQQWKELLVSATEEDSMVARGFFGPMRFIRNSQALKLVDATIKGAPDLYKGIPCGSSNEIIKLEIQGLENLWKGDIDNTPVLGGMAAGRIHEIPKVSDLINRIMQDAEQSIKNSNRFII